MPQPRYHWSLNSAYAGRIPGNPGNPMAVLGDVDIRKGVATLNGKGFLDAGDFQGECLSGKKINLKMSE